MEGDLKMANELSIQAEALQNLLISQATGGSEDDAEFVRLRQALLSNTALDSLVPLNRPGFRGGRLV